MTTTSTCAECACSFAPKRAWSRYCSRACGGRHRSRNWTQKHPQQARDNSARQNAKRLPYSPATVDELRALIAETNPAKHVELAEWLQEALPGYAYLSREIESFIYDTLGDWT